MCAWDATQPTDNTKLRLGPGLVRANWDALQAGECPFDALELVEQAASPPAGITPAAGFGFLYSFLSGGNTELFFVNGASTVSQLTNLQKTNVDTRYVITTPWNLIIAWGSRSVTSAGHSFTWQSVGNAFSSAPFVIATVSDSAGTTNVTTYNVTVTGASLKTSAAGPYTVYYIAIGV